MATLPILPQDLQFYVFFKNFPPAVVPIPVSDLPNSNFSLLRLGSPTVRISCPFIDGGRSSQISFPTCQQLLCAAISAPIDPTRVLSPEEANDSVRD
ncbi:Hypothetical protein NTJ_10826 [Nesidiocoris tenuis]|uniref:Uncharacterized protein n=1 Tax=Nesidiocoris tenuis TaxID=355587 RepID=A0ABN7B4C8_9HEMI|nr:Hypothetical protein NTJ_10826 [Nesidiocoris tenuis]